MTEKLRQSMLDEVSGWLLPSINGQVTETGFSFTHRTAGTIKMSSDEFQMFWDEGVEVLAEALAADLGLLETQNSYFGR